MMNSAITNGKGPVQVITGARLIDGKGGPPVEGAGVLVENSRIIQVGQAHEIKVPEGAEAKKYDFSDCTILPGLIDVHTHLIFPGDGRGILEVMSEEDEIHLLRAAKNAETALRSGVTTIRDNGARNRVTLSLREAVGRGICISPRLNLCKWPITITGGHCWQMGGEADGMDGVRYAVRKLIKESADYIKVMATGGATPNTFPFLPSYTSSELNALSDEAHRFGKSVAAHCCCTEAIVFALEAKVDMLIHCTLRESKGAWKFDPKVAERIAKAEIWVNPTLHVGQSRYWALLEEEEQKGSTDEIEASILEAKESWENRIKNFRQLKDAGVKMVAGGDTGWGHVPFGNFVNEIEAMYGEGLTPMAAILSATRDAAKSMGLDDKVGVLEPGKEADIVVIEGNPLMNMKDLGRIKAVFKAGEKVGSGWGHTKNS